MFPLSEFYVVWQVLCTEVDDDARELFFAAGGFIMDFIKNNTPTICSSCGVLVQILCMWVMVSLEFVKQMRGVT